MTSFWEQTSRIISGDAFLASFEPPDWLLDGIVQKGRLYACTSLTGHGKTAVWLYFACMIHAGRLAGTRETDKGNVLYLAGENPQDLQARLHGMCRHFKIPALDTPYVLPRSFPLTDQERDLLAREIDELNKPLSLIIGDTAASFFPSQEIDSENSNVVAGRYARTLRSLTECDGNPAVVTLCHPTKHADRDSLLPRGGGGFLNELDANLSLWSEQLGQATTLHYCQKIRGPDFNPVAFNLKTVWTGFNDKKDRPVDTIVAIPVDDEEAASQSKQNLANQMAVLKAIHDHPDAPSYSYAAIARDVGWLNDANEPERWKAQRVVKVLATARLLEQLQPGATWTLTTKGQKALNGQKHL